MGPNAAAEEEEEEVMRTERIRVVVATERLVVDATDRRPLLAEEVEVKIVLQMQRTIESIHDWPTNGAEQW